MIVFADLNSECTSLRSSSGDQRPASTDRCEAEDHENVQQAFLVAKAKEDLVVSDVDDSVDSDVAAPHV